MPCYGCDERYGKEVGGCDLLKNIEQCILRTSTRTMCSFECDVGGTTMLSAMYFSSKKGETLQDTCDV